MLSYRHSYHAGNFADVLKHIVQIEILQHLGKKDKPFDYIDTHSGAGLYDLTSVHASKLQEFNNGIGKLNIEQWPELSRYFEVIKQFNSNNELAYYPGSPLIAAQFLRPSDKAWLYEIHPSDLELLQQNTARLRNVRVNQSDGFTGLIGLLPPQSRRALVLIDPSYEIKTDYDKIFNVVTKAYKRFATGTYAIWYPVVDRDRINALEQKFVQSGIKDIQLFELGLSADTDGSGMTSSGMLVINPPWHLFEKMTTLLPKLATELAGAGGVYRCEQLVSE